MKNRLVGADGQEWGEYRELLCSGRTVMYLDFNGGYTNKYMDKTEQKYTHTHTKNEYI